MVFFVAPMFVTPVPRIDPPAVADERTALSAFLDFHRATLLRKLDGLDDDLLRRSVVPSGVTLLGLVKHLTEVEHGWFVNEYGQLDEPPLFETEDDPDAGFRVGSDESTHEIVSAYVAVCGRARRIVAAAPSLDDTVPSARRGRVDLRRIMLHMVEETARHNGHADVIRELLDGTVGD